MQQMTKSLRAQVGAFRHQVASLPKSLKVTASVMAAIGMLAEGAHIWQLMEQGKELLMIVTFMSSSSNAFNKLMPVVRSMDASMFAFNIGHMAVTFLNTILLFIVTLMWWPQGKSTTADDE